VVGDERRDAPYASGGRLYISLGKSSTNRHPRSAEKHEDTKDERITDWGGTATNYRLSIRSLRLADGEIPILSLPFIPFVVLRVLFVP
jgi:hypothetical protein